MDRIDRPPRFSVGERVVDRDADEPTALIVLDPDRGLAENITIDERDETIAELNPDYSPSERVVECIHEEWLERHAASVWRGWRGKSFPSKLAEFARTWRLRPRTYDYPEGRLQSIDDPDSDPSTTERDTVGHGDRQTSIDQWR